MKEYKAPKMNINIFPYEVSCAATIASGTTSENPPINGMPSDTTRIKLDDMKKIVTFTI